MIIREWRGRAHQSKAAQYPKHFRSVVIPELHEVHGFLGAFLGEMRNGDHVEFLVLTRWESMDAIHAFAGTDPRRAVVEPGTIAALSDYDKTVRHYEILEDVPQK